MDLSVTFFGSDDASEPGRHSAKYEDILAIAAEADRLGFVAVAQRETLAEFAFERYLAWGGLLGTEPTCRKTLLDLRELGVDEVACFVDFGLDRDDVLAGLRRLAAIRRDIAI